MSEMSLTQQINAIDEVIEYIWQVENDVHRLNEEVDHSLTHFRQNGMRTEIIEMIKSTHMGHINEELDKLLNRMINSDMDYLIRVREDLSMTNCEQ